MRVANGNVSDLLAVNIYEVRNPAETVYNGGLGRMAAPTVKITSVRQGGEDVSVCRYLGDAACRQVIEVGNLA